MPKITRERVLRDIEEYCEVNSLDMEDFTTEILYKGLMITKYGDKPKEVTVEKQKISEPTVYEIPNSLLEPPKEAQEEHIQPQAVEVHVETKKKLRRRKIEVK